MEFFRVQPKVIRERVEGTFIKGGAITEGNAKRLIASCNVCGACGDRCPEGIDIGEFLLRSRRRLHREEDMPPAWHDFWLRDMAFASGEEAGLCRPAPGGGPNRYLYFPGCQMGASDPRYVSESYRWILRHEPGTALLLGCCGAPAEWAGREEEREARVSDLRARWEELGRPTAVFACPSCRKMFLKYIPEMPGVSVYELMAPWGAPEAAAVKPVAVFDPCSSRQAPEMQKSVRTLLSGAGFPLEELPAAGRDALCCGWGGGGAAANPAYAEKVTRKRMAQSETPYACYCTNCRDSFAEAGKESRHVFDLLFGLSGADRPATGASRRRENRTELQRMLLMEFWNEEKEAPQRVKLYITPELSRRLDKELILEDDLRQTIAACERSGKKLIDTRSGRMVGHLVLGPVTYWVEYEPFEDGWRVWNAYSHRLIVQERDKLAGRGGD
jgi:Fe-S oxidoreductase